jgi:hypothetical protein
MATFRSDRLTCVPIGCKNRIDRPVVQALRFGHRLCWACRGTVCPPEGQNTVCRAGFLPARSPATGSVPIKNPDFIIQNKKQSF